MVVLGIPAVEEGVGVAVLGAGCASLSPPSQAANNRPKNATPHAPDSQYGVVLDELAVLGQTVVVRVGEGPPRSFEMLSRASPRGEQFLARYARIMPAPSAGRFRPPVR